MSGTCFTKAIGAIILFTVITTITEGQAIWLSPSDTAFIPKEIEDPECLGIHKEPAHASLMPYANLTEALRADRHASAYYRSLNGLWKFNWVTWPQQRPVDFYK